MSGENRLSVRLFVFSDVSVDGRFVLPAAAVNGKGLFRPISQRVCRLFGSGVTADAGHRGRSGVASVECVECGFLFTAGETAAEFTGVESGGEIFSGVEKTFSQSGV